MGQEKILLEIGNAVAEGEENDAVALAKQAFEMGVDPLAVMNQGASKGLDIIGDLFNRGEAFLPELVNAGNAMRLVINLVLEQTKGDAAASRAGKVVIGQAGGDVHDIGKNLVSSLLAINGFEVIDLGTDVNVKTFYEKATEHEADIVAMSTLLTTSLPFMSDAEKYFTDTGVRDQFFLIVGGGPVTPEFAVSIGADGWGQSALDCVELCKRLMNGGKPGSGDTVVVDLQAEKKG
jgi:methylmalonyl-CoA mutase cobalamin-binding domain/chain